jgi:hypothetical protein
MPSLRELQTAFAHDLFSGTAEATADHVVGDGFAEAQRLQIYRNNLFLSLADALAAVYPLVQRLVGEAFFQHAAHAYICQHPSRSGNLHGFGAAFPPFLETFAPAAALAYLPDVARLEWSWHQVFHAAEHPPLRPARLAEVPPQRYGALRFRFHPATALLSSPYPVLRIWEVNQADHRGEPAVDLRSGAEHLLVCRSGLAVTLHRLPSAEFAFLAALREGSTLEDAVRQALASAPEFDLNATLSRQVQLATLVDIAL